MINKKDVERLKKDWLRDPCWDIEETEGFSNYKKDLKIFSLETKLKNVNREIEALNFMKISLKKFLGI